MNINHSDEDRINSSVELKQSGGRQVPFSVSVLLILFLVFTLYIAVTVYEGEAHIPILITAVVAGIIAMIYGYQWQELEETIMETMVSTIPSLLIFCIVGILIGLWILGGIVPTMIYYGLRLISPAVFLPVTSIICSLVALASGSSWTTVGTVGIALMGVGHGMGMPPAMVAGAIVSGAYFGDKVSPLSDTTNMAPAVAGTDLFTHIRHMVYTTTPSYIISLLLFAILGFQYSGDRFEASVINDILAGISMNFTITPLLLIPPILIIILVIRKVPPIPTLLISSSLGALGAVIFQAADFGDIVHSAHYGFVSETGLDSIDELLSGGGLDSMLNPLSLVFMTISLAGIMEKTGMMQSLADKILSVAKGVGGLIAATVGTCIGVNVLTGDQYLSIVFTGKMYQKQYQKMGLHPKNLSRTLEDAGTLTSPLIPWGACGIFMASTLGVPTVEYLPFAFFNLINPIVATIYGFTGFTIEKLVSEGGASGSEK